MTGGGWIVHHDNQPSGCGSVLKPITDPASRKRGLTSFSCARTVCGRVGVTVEAGRSRDGGRIVCRFPNWLRQCLDGWHDRHSPN
jgi:hypothetical protein